MIDPRIIRPMALPVLLGLLPILAGCGGGASAVPTVTIKGSTDPAELTSDPSNQGTTAAGGVGNLVGKVVFDGPNPNLPTLFGVGQANKDTSVCAHDAPIPNEDIVVGPGGGLANVFIYLQRAPKGIKLPPVPQEPLTFDQKNCTFTTRALLVRCGQEVAVLSDDGIAHNTHTHPGRNTERNLNVPPDDRVGINKLQYPRPENAPFLVNCDIHSWMKSYHLALDHPFGAVTKADGTFEIKDLPAGKHDFRIWQEIGKSNGLLERKYPVTIKAGETTNVEISFKASDFNL